MGAGVRAGALDPRVVFSEGQGIQISFEVQLQQKVGYDPVRTDDVGKVGAGSFLQRAVVVNGGW